jgi:hypothetical protein
MNMTDIIKVQEFKYTRASHNILKIRTIAKQYFTNLARQWYVAILNFFFNIDKCQHDPRYVYWKMNNTNINLIGITP